MEFLINESTVVAVAFVVFCGLAYKPLKKLVLKFLDQKIVDAVKSIEEAAKMRKEAEGLLKQSQKQLIEANDTAVEIVKNAKQKALHIFEKAEQSIDAITKRRVEVSLARIAQREQQIIEDFKKQAVEVAIKEARNFIVGKLSKDQQLNLIENDVRNINKIIN